MAHTGIWLQDKVAVYLLKFWLRPLKKICYSIENVCFFLSLLLAGSTANSYSSPSPNLSFLHTYCQTCTQMEQGWSSLGARYLTHLGQVSVLYCSIYFPSFKFHNYLIHYNNFFQSFILLLFSLFHFYCFVIQIQLLKLIFWMDMPFIFSSSSSSL